MYSETAAAAGLAYARTDDYAFEGSADATLPAIGAGVKFDSVISDHLALIRRRSVRARDLAAQPTLHNALSSHLWHSENAGARWLPTFVTPDMRPETVRPAAPCHVKSPACRPRWVPS